MNGVSVFRQKHPPLFGDIAFVITMRRCEHSTPVACTVLTAALFVAVAVEGSSQQQNHACEGDGCGSGSEIDRGKLYRDVIQQAAKAAQDNSATDKQQPHTATSEGEWGPPIHPAQEFPAASYQYCIIGAG
jgi:hypothetical protein